MNIILLGNGFDIAHGLPTTYTNFLDFLKRIGAKDNRMIFDVQLNEQLSDIMRNDDNTNTLNTMRKLCANNMWAKYFFERNNMYPNWCDFESEIEYITQNLQNIKKELEKNRELLASHFFHSNASIFLQYSIKTFLFNIVSKDQDVRDGYKIITLDTMPTDIILSLGNNSLNENNIIDIILDNTAPTSSISIPFEYLISFIIDQLNTFTKCFELYLSEFINKFKIQKIQFISKLMSNYDLKILNFNYTSTIEFYKSLYNDDICYIHGQARNNDNNNLVLGINETENEIDPMFTRFRKYFQRFEKNCSNNYRSWIKNIKNRIMSNQLSIGSAENKLYIIGHSLTLNDKNILNELITLPGMFTTIYYHSESSKLNLMQNLAAILGSQKFTEYMEANAITFEQGEFEKKIT